MKHILAVDESGMPVYYDHKDGLMLCPIISAVYNSMKGSFEETIKTWSCGKCRFFLKTYLPLLFLIVSDQGEPDAVLHSQVNLVHQIFMLLFGPEKLYNRKRSLDKFKATIQRLIDTTFQLIEENQSILVQSIEVLDVNEQIKAKCSEMLAKVLHSCPGASHVMLFVGTKLVAWNFTQKQTNINFNSMDMFLLILFFRTEFHPLIRELEFTKLSIADYTDHEEVIAGVLRGDNNAYQGMEDAPAPDSEDGATSPDEEGGFDTAPEDWEESYTSNRNTFSAENPIILFQSGWLDEIFNEGAHLPIESTSPTSPGNLSATHPLNLTVGLRLEAAQALLEALRTGLKQGDTKDNDAVVLLQYALSVLGFTPEQVVDEGNFGSATKEAVTSFQKANSLPSTGDADPATMVHILKQTRTANAKQKTAERPTKDEKGRDKAAPQGTPPPPESFAGSTPVKSKSNLDAYPTTPTTPSFPFANPPPSPSPILPNSTNNSSAAPSPMRSANPTPYPGTPFSPAFSTPPASRIRAQQPARSVLEQLYFQCRKDGPRTLPQHLPVWVYCAEIHEATTLVVMNQGLKGTAEDKERLDKSQHLFREWLRKNYAQYLITKECTHIPILNSIHSLPGLVHYIFVNHQNNRVQAPTITPLSGLVHRDQKLTDRMLVKLRREVWRLVHTGQEYLANGYTSMLVRKNDFTYSYRLWIVDDEGVEQVIDRSALPILKETPIGYRFYKELVHKLFPSQAMQLVCLELYTLYLGVLPTAMVSKNDRALITMLHPQGDHKKVRLQSLRKISYTLDMITRYASLTNIYIKLANEPNRILPVKDVLAPKKERTKFIRLSLSSMKYLLVVDETGNPIYYDHPDGPMLCPVLATTYAHMKGNFDCVCRALSCGKTKFVQHQYETLVFLLVSDQGEPDSVLRSQLHLVYQLILLLFGPTNLHQRRRALDRFKKTIQKLVDTAFHLLETNQSVLVQSIELLEVNKDILGKCMSNLKTVIANCPGATHALLFVGTKLLAWYFRPKSFQLSSMDMFLLILFFRGAFHPILREVAFTKLHVADYTDHEEVIREATRAGTAGSLLPTDSDVASTTDDMNTGLVDDSVSMDDAFDTMDSDREEGFNEPITIDVAHPVLLLQSGWLDEIFDPDTPAPSLDTASSSSSDIPMNLTQTIRADAAQGVLEALRAGLKEGQQNDGVAVLQHAMHFMGLTPTAVVDGGAFGAVTKEGVANFQHQNSIHPTGEADVATLAAIIRKARAISGETGLNAEKLAQLDRISKLERLPSEKIQRPLLVKRGSLVMSSSAPSGASPIIKRSESIASELSRPPSRTDDTPPSSSSAPFSPTESTRSGTSTTTRTSTTTPVNPDSTVFEQLYLRVPTHLPMWVYCSELQEITTLVVINKGLTGTKDERERLDRARDTMKGWLHKSYASYLLAKERTHGPILQSLPQFPGLIHYIFVDRTTNRVRAPTISPLHGQTNRDPVATERMLTKLRRETQQLVHTAQEHLAQGFTSMLVRKHDFLYSYRLWVEDDEGVEQVIEQSIPTNENLHRTPLGHRFYKELLRWLFPSQSQQMKCYELYTLYLGILPAALVSKNDRALIAMMLERDVD